MRLGPADPITVTDGVGAVARGVVSEADPDRLMAEVDAVEHRPRPEPDIVVYQAAAKGTKIDEAVERLAELGAAEVHVFGSQRSVVRWDAAKAGKLEQRWRVRALAAAKQSHNPWPATVGGVLPWAGLAGAVASEPTALVLWGQAVTRLRSSLPREARRIALVVGPEGGLSDDEVSELSAGGAMPVSLGATILRTENAALVAASAVGYHYGRIG